MKDHASAGKENANSTDSSPQHSFAAGNEAIALAPPASGIEFIDRGLVGGAFSAHGIAPSPIGKGLHSPKQPIEAMHAGLRAEGSRTFGVFFDGYGSNNRQRNLTATAPLKTVMSEPLHTAGAIPVLQRKCTCGAGAPGSTGEWAESSKKLGLQTKLRINEPGDAYQQEADRVAEQVLAKPAHPGASSAPLRIQRHTGQATGNVDTAPASVDRALASPGRPLEPALLQDIEQRFGHDFSGVRVHSGAAAEQSAQDVNANAYTVGQNIVFGQGRFEPGTQEGRNLIAHELTHVVQQDGEQLQRVQMQAKVGAATSGAPSGREKGPLNFLSTDPKSRTYFVWEPGEWAAKVAPIFRQHGWSGTIVTLGSNTSVAFDADGDSVRQVPIRLPDNARASSVWKLEVAHATWRTADDILYAGPDPTQPLAEAGVKALAEAMGITYGGTEKVWIMLLVDPEMRFERPEPAKVADTKTTGNTAAMRAKAKAVLADLGQTWSKRPQAQGAALAGTPSFTQRYSDRTGWHIRITLDQEQTEVSLSSGDSEKDVRDRVDAAVKRMREQYQAPKPEGVPGKRTLKPNVVDPMGKDAPDWYVPYDSSPAAKKGKAIAAAPPLPAFVVFKNDVTNTHPTVMAGSTYDFAMKVQWQYAGDLEGLSLVGNYGYYWEILAASPDDYFRLSGEARPEGMPEPAPAAAGTAAPAAPPAPKTEDKAAGSGTRVTTAEDFSVARKAKGREVGEDMAADYEEGDYSGFAGEAVAGGFRIVKTQVVSAISDILDRRDPSSRRITLPEPGYYLIRCISYSTHADEKSAHVRSPSVAVIPVKAQLNWGVAKAMAKGDLEKAAGQGAYARYVAELASTSSMLESARKLEARFKADPALQGKLSSDPVAAAADLSVLELGVLALADQNNTSVEQFVKDLAGQVKELEADDQKDVVTSWHGELKAGPDSTTDYPVGGSFVVDDSGQQISLKLMVGQAKDSSDAKPHWVVFDITTGKTRDRYEGYGRVSGVPVPAEMGGHGAALREALREFAGNNPYGYGEIWLAWPSAFGGVTNMNAGDLPRHLRSAPGAEKRKKARHSAYVDIATLLIPAAKAAKLRGLVKGAETFVALAGAANAIGSLQDRARTHHLAEPGTLLEIVNVIGAVRTLGEGAKFVFNANDLVRAARRVGESLELLTKLENGIQIISIPFVVRQQLKALDELKGASAEHKAATLAFVLGRAIKQGVVSVRAINPGEQTQFYDDSKDPNKPGGGGGDPSKGGGGGGGGGGGPTGPIPPELHHDLQQFADVYRVVINVRQDAPDPKSPDPAIQAGALRAEIHWAGTRDAQGCC